MSLLFSLRSAVVSHLPSNGPYQVTAHPTSAHHFNPQYPGKVVIIVLTELHLLFSFAWYVNVQFFNGCTLTLHSPKSRLCI